MTDLEKKEIINYRLSKAKYTLKEIDILMANQLWNTAINRLYYASFHAVTALLLANNIVAQTHSGVRQMFGLHFIKTGKINIEFGRFFSEIFDKRHTGDYDDFIEFTEQDVTDFLAIAKQFIDAIEQMII